jgi:hypothetical protein
MMGGILWWIHHFVSQNEGVLLIGLSGLSFLFYGYLLLLPMTVRQIFIAAIGLRCLLFWGMPHMSDDIFRFIWDGSITLSGHSPYGILPADALKAGWQGVSKSIFEQMNSPGYYTVYPPVSQCYYALTALGGELSWSVLILRILLTVTEITGLWYVIRLLRHWHKPIHWAAIFILNPLVLLEGTGNLHFEPAMFSLLAISMYQMERGRWKTAAFWFAVSIGLKLLPLMLLPWLWLRCDRLQKKVFFTQLGVWLLVIFCPLLIAPGLWGMGKSVGLYFQNFEFNASVYFLIRELVSLYTGYNAIAWIGPVLGFLAAMCICTLAYLWRRLPLSDVGRFGLAAWTIYLLLATTVHPWYAVGPLFFGLFTGRIYTVFWSWLVLFSYTLYGNLENTQWNAWIFLEYLLLGGMMLGEKYIGLPINFTKQIKEK